MKSKRSSDPSITIIKSDLKRFWILSLIAFVVLFLSGAFIFLMSNTGSELTEAPFRNNNNIGFNLNPNNINNPQYFNINRENNPFGIPNPNINRNNTIIMNQNIPNYNYINNGINQINQINNSINNINYRIIKCGNKFSNNDINDIIITCNQGYKGREDPLSKWIIQRIKAKLGGDWVVFICAIGLKGYDLSVSLDDENRFISFIIDNFKFQIIKIKDLLIIHEVYKDLQMNLNKKYKKG